MVQNVTTALAGDSLCIVGRLSCEVVKRDTVIHSCIVSASLQFIEHEFKSIACFLRECNVLGCLARVGPGAACCPNAQQQITARILEGLKAGCIPWRKTWPPR
jgi:hypothetical protein